MFPSKCRDAVARICATELHMWESDVSGEPFIGNTKL